MYIISIEGKDGVGKSTIAVALMDKLRNKYNLNAYYHHFPDYSKPIGECIGKLLKTEMFKECNPYANVALYITDRYMFFKEIEEKYDNSILIVDRYHSSTLVYQVAQKILRVMPKSSEVSLHTISEFIDYDLIDYIDEFEYNILKNPKPNLVFYINRNDNDRKTDLDKKEKDSFESDKRFGEITGCLYDYFFEDNKRLNSFKVYNASVDDSVDSICSYIFKNCKNLDSFKQKQ